MTGARISGEKLGQISELLVSKSIVPVVGRIFPLAEARQVQELRETDHGRGRITLRIS